MADKRFAPKSLNVAQRDTVAVAGTWATSDTTTVTINEKDLTLTIGAVTTTTGIASAVAAMINGDDALGTETRSETGDNVAEFEEVAAEVSGSVVSVTGNTKGRPFTLTVVETTAGDGTATEATATAATSINHWDNVDNWGGVAIPADTDVVYVDHSDVSILYGLGQSAIQPAALYVPMSYTGSIGLPEVNAEGQYTEYRKTYLEIGPTVLEIGAGVGIGSPSLKFNTGTDQVALSLLNSGSATGDLPAVIWKGTHASNALVMRGGSLGVAIFGAEVATLATFTVDAGELTLGSGVTLSGALVVNGGVVRINSKIDGSLTTTSGQVTIDGTADVDQLTIRGGTVVFNTSGTLGGATVISGDGVLDLSRDSRPLAGVSAAIDMHGTNCRIIDPFKRLGNVVIDFNEGSSPTQVDFGQNIRLTRGSVA